MSNLYFKWDEDFITGVESIDEQHYKLVEIINDLLKCSFDSEDGKLQKINDLHKRLTKYAIYHFNEEENLMESFFIDSRHLDIHKKIHKEFITKISNFFEYQLNDNEYEDLEEINEFLIRWLAYHILNMDKSVVRQMKYISEDGLSPLEAYEKEENLVEVSTEPLLKALKALFYIVSEKNQQLEQKNIELEEKVKERTSELEKLNLILKDLSLKDELTGLANRRYALLEIDKLINNWKRYDTVFSILFIDVDKFKAVNDNYGHEYGDQVLKWIADFLSNNIRKTDILCRLGGDEFIVICAHCNKECSMELARKINDLSKSLTENEKLSFWEPSFSIGVAEIDKNIESSSDILTNADIAMYSSKKSGGGAYSIYKIDNSMKK